jgi:hypothetical protein
MLSFTAISIKIGRRSRNRWTLSSLKESSRKRERGYRRRTSRKKLRKERKNQRVVKNRKKGMMIS